MLEDHRARNRPMLPPNLDIPDAAVTGHGRLEDEEEDEPSTHRARRYSKTPRDAEPKATTMKYYPPGWRAVLEMAKNNMRKHVALVNAFPQRDRDLKDATLILNNTVTEYLQIEGNTLEPGCFFCFFTYWLLIICFRIFPGSRYEYSGSRIFPFISIHLIFTNLLPRFSMNIQPFAKN